MTRGKETATRRPRGSIDALPSGALRVRVYAGVDPVTKRRHTLSEIVPAGPDAERRARAARDRFISQVQERRNPRTSATVDQLLHRYLEHFDGAPKTLTLYRGYVRKHISPFLGHIKVGALDADVLDAFYAELRRCRDHCTGRQFVQHRTTGKHECDHRCGPHRCRPLGPTTIRHMHFILSGAYKRAVRWKWVTTSPVAQAEPPAAPKPNPHPPTPDEAARILNAAWEDPDWGTLVWCAMTTGARRGELCALRWAAVDLTEGRETVWLRRAISRTDEGWVEGDLKTHQQRRVALDAQTAEVLREHRDRCASRVRSLGWELDGQAFVFSGAPDGGTFVTPGALTQRYERLADRLRIDTTLHKLRHYSATELISAGVDVRTVAGRLGHSSGGTTTLRTYAAWVSEADQRAARGIASSMPTRPAATDAVERAKADPRRPYEKIAAQLCQRILTGELRDGDPAPTEKQVAQAHGVAAGTAHRAMQLLNTWGLVTATRGRRAVVQAPAANEPDSGPDSDSGSASSATSDELQYWTITLRGPDGRRFPPRTIKENIRQPDRFRAHLVAIARIEAPSETDSGEGWIGAFELEIREPGAVQSDPVMTLRWQDQQ